MTRRRLITELALKHLSNTPTRAFIVALMFSISAVGSSAAVAADAATSGATGADVGLAQKNLDDVDAFMNHQVADHKIAGGVVMISHGGKTWLHAYGQADLEAKKPFKADTIVRLYSMSKAITTAGALALYEQGKLKLDDPVAKYIPSFIDVKVAADDGVRAPAKPPTVRDLMLHVSGLTYGDGPAALCEAFGKLKPMEAPDLKEMADRLAKVPLAFDPETQWNYGTGIDVLGRIVEVVSGQPLDEYLRKTIFEPLNMPDTAFSVPADKLDRFAANYKRTANGLEVIDVPAKSKFAGKVTLFSGGGGLVGTAGDYMRFLTMIHNGGQLNGKHILKAETVRLMITNQLPEKAFPIHFGKEIRYGTGYGLGFNVRTEITKWDPAGHEGEYGWGGAASTHYWASPADDLIVVTLEQIMPYEWDTEFGVKKLIYDAAAPRAPGKRS